MILRYLLPVLVAVVLYGAGYYRGGAREHERSELEIAKWKLQASQSEAIAVAALAKSKEAVRVKTVTKLKRVPVYVPANTPDLPGSFRVLYDAAASGRGLPDTPDVSAPPTSAQDVATSIIENFGKYHEAEEYVRTLNEWAARQK